MYIFLTIIICKLAWKALWGVSNKMYVRSIVDCSETACINSSRHTQCHNDGTHVLNLVLSHININELAFLPLDVALILYELSCIRFCACPVSLAVIGGEHKGREELIGCGMIRECVAQHLRQTAQAGFLITTRATAEGQLVDICFC